MKPITAIQIFYEPQVGTEQEVLRTFFSFVGCLVKTTRMSAEDMSKQHKILAHPENKQTAYLFLTDCYPGDSEPAENELWCAFSIKEQKLIINGADAIQGRSSVMRFEKEALNDIIRHVWRGDAMAVASLQHINETFWQFDMFAHLQIKSTFQVLKMSELKALSLKSDYKLPEDSFLNEMADFFIGLEKQSRVGPQSIYSVYAYVNAQRHLRELTAALETYTSLTIRLLSILEPVEKLLSELNKIYRVAPGFVPMYRLAAAFRSKDDNTLDSITASIGFPADKENDVIAQTLDDEDLVTYVIGALHDLAAYMRPSWLDNEDSSLTLDVSLDGVKCQSRGGLVTMTVKGYTFDVEG